METEENLVCLPLAEQSVFLHPPPLTAVESPVQTITVSVFTKQTARAS
jgi:hypothetical protein